mmetsp:Transcript_8580/g.10114  ORF Transcript_8580/g.10114 Transcript_8580/m.10114 type:complete len:120 (+) Transcript_8580:726-1085(+)
MSDFPSSKKPSSEEEKPRSTPDRVVGGVGEEPQDGIVAKPLGTCVKVISNAEGAAASTEQACAEAEPVAHVAAVEKAVMGVPTTVSSPEVGQKHPAAIAVDTGLGTSKVTSATLRSAAR